MDGTGMEKRIYLPLTVLGLLLVFIGVPILSAGTQSIPSQTIEPSTTMIDMIIILSPQYADDSDIKKSINFYIDSIQEDLDWTTQLIALDQENNDYTVIDQLIEHYHFLYHINACIMVGEDIDTALAGDSDYMEKPSTIPWATLGGDRAYEISNQGIVVQPHTIDIAISLLYPTHSLDYQTKKSHIISAFEKFSTRNKYSLDNIFVSEASDINHHSKELYQHLNTYGNLTYSEDSQNILASINKKYSMYFIHGHSNPSGTDVNKDNTGWFSATYVNYLQTPFFGADGCYVNGWWSDQKDNNVLDPSINTIWYGSTIFTSKHVQVMALGLLSQQGFSYPVSFIEHVIPDLCEGKTLAESVLGDTFVDTTILIGDPTFHFHLY
jgi:hypothetical protein